MRYFDTSNGCEDKSCLEPIMSTAKKVRGQNVRELNVKDRNVQLLVIFIILHSLNISSSWPQNHVKRNQVTKNSTQQSLTKNKNNYTVCVCYVYALYGVVKGKTTKNEIVVDIKKSVTIAAAKVVYKGLMMFRIKRRPNLKLNNTVLAA